MTIRVLINGAHGRMGQQTSQAINEHANLELVGEIGHQDDLLQKINESKAQVVIDFTTPDVVFNSARTIISAGVHPIIGTSGLSAEQISSLQASCEEQQLGGIIAPNFSIGAILMMHFAKQAAAFYQHVEIIESHHNKKIDAPSGTAMKTADMIAQGRQHMPEPREEKIILEGARGGNYHEVPIHSVRLPGVVAAQQVIFSANSETLTIDHNTIHREAFMPGVCLACEKVSELKGLIYGLEHILF